MLDTGVRTSHDDFEGRAEPGWSARCNDVARNCTEWAEYGDITAENFAASKANDCAFSGHGTHVASTVAGKEYGVAKGAPVVAVQVLDCRGQGEAADIIGGIEWAVADAAARGTTQAVIQMSITNTYSETQKDVVKAAHDAGVVIVLAAGNREADTCGWSYLLGGIHIVINVGSSTSADTVSGFSSFGDCVDLFAPGSNIDAAWVDSDSAVTSLSGTSMAAPHVSGAVAQLRAQRPELDADGVTEVLLCMATEDALTGVPRRTPNLFLYAGSAMDNDAHTSCQFPPKAPPPPMPPPSPPYAPYQKPCKCEVPWPCYSPGSDSCSGSGNMDDYPDDAAIIAYCPGRACLPQEPPPSSPPTPLSPPAPSPSPADPPAPPSPPSPSVPPLPATDAFSGSVLASPSEASFLVHKLGDAATTVIDGLTDACHRMSRDGDDRSACSRRGPSVVIARLSTGVVVGGFTGSAEWGLPYGYMGDRSCTAFLFSLTTQRRYDLSYCSSTSVIYESADDDSYRAPIFGGGHDLSLGGTSCNVGHTFKSDGCVANRDACIVDFCGAKDGWTVVDYEIWVAPAGSPSPPVSPPTPQPPAPPSFPPLPETSAFHGSTLVSADGSPHREVGRPHRLDSRVLPRLARWLRAEDLPQTLRRAGSVGGRRAAADRKRGARGRRLHRPRRVGNPGGHEWRVQARSIVHRLPLLADQRLPPRLKVLQQRRRRHPRGDL